MFLKENRKHNHEKKEEISLLNMFLEDHILCFYASTVCLYFKSFSTLFGLEGNATHIKNCKRIAKAATPQCEPSKRNHRKKQKASLLVTGARLEENEKKLKSVS